MLHLDTLEQVLDQIIARWGIPGLGIGIVEGEKIAYARGFGVQSLETQTPVCPGAPRSSTSTSTTRAAA